tara:strand:+ start:136 stop:330 length:195 start_codon:yes stop_codon:yes gene_type:complete
MLIAIAVLVGIYFYMQKSQKNVEEPMENHQLEPFIPSDSFVGAKEGYVFKMDDVGLGYYLDNKQ